MRAQHIWTGLSFKWNAVDIRVVGIESMQNIFAGVGISRIFLRNTFNTAAFFCLCSA